MPRVCEFLAMPHLFGHPERALRESKDLDLSRRALRDSRKIGSGLPRLADSLQMTERGKLRRERPNLGSSGWIHAARFRSVIVELRAEDRARSFDCTRRLAPLRMTQEGSSQSLTQKIHKVSGCFLSLGTSRQQKYRHVF